MSDNATLRTTLQEHSFQGGKQGTPLVVAFHFVDIRVGSCIVKIDILLRSVSTYEFST